MIRNYFFYTITFLFIVMFCSFAFVHPSIANGQAPDNTQNSYKLELIPLPQDVTWEDWRPKNNKVLPINAVIVAVAGTVADITSTTEYTFILSEVSDYKGYCMNFGTQPGDKKDIYFRQSDQPKDTEQLKYRVSGKNGETLKVTCESSTFSIPIFVFVDDYGAHGILDGAVSLNDKKDENGRELDTTPSNNDTASGRLSIPKDNNGNDIADGWKNDVVRNYDPWVDKETGPGINMNSGDGFTTFEEYRGFMVKGKYRDTDPVKAKDLFIYSDFTEGYGYASNLPGVFSLYEINKKEMATNRRVSINSCGSGRGNYGKSYSRDHPDQDMLIDGDPQSAVHVQDASGNEELEQAYRFVLGVVVKNQNVPYKVKYCLVFPTRIADDLKDIDKHPKLDGYFTHLYTDRLKSTIGHEIGHCMCLVHPTPDKLKEDFGVLYGVSIMEGHTLTLGPDATVNEERNLQAAVVNARHRAGYVYPAALHTTTYKLVLGSDTSASRCDEPCP